MKPVIYVFFGGISEERDVSIRTGAAIRDTLIANHNVQCVLIEDAELPSGIHYEEGVVFPALHGRFGEDGELQSILERDNIEFVGCDSKSSFVCFHKAETKKALRGLPLIPGMDFNTNQLPDINDILMQLGDDVVFKPACQGSSVGLRLVQGFDNVVLGMSSLEEGDWLCEKRIHGRELTVGILEGKALGIVEVFPEGGVYDFQRKYQAGETKYEFPAQLDDALTKEIVDISEEAFSRLGCRDFARIDFMLQQDKPYLMEVNTMPGMTETSLMPKSASCSGYDFEGLVSAMLEPALKRFKEREKGR